MILVNQLVYLKDGKVNCFTIFSFLVFRSLQSTDAQEIVKQMCVTAHTNQTGQESTYRNHLIPCQKHANGLGLPKLAETIFYHSKF